MYDLIISVNAPASRRNQFIVLETYYTKGVTLSKNGRYKGGSITAADMTNLMPVGNGNFDVINQLFSKFCRQIAFNAYYVSTDNFYKFFQVLNATNLFFLDTVEKDLLVIDSLNDDITGIKKKHQYIVGDKSLIYYANNAFSIKEYPEGGKVSIRWISPTPVLYYSNEEHVYSLYFEYGNERINCWEKKYSVNVDEIVFLRNYKFEHETGETLIRDRFVKISRGRFIYSGYESKNAIDQRLNSKGIFLQDEENTIIPRLIVSKRDAGWFDIDLSCNIDGAVINLASQIDLFSSKGVLEINGKKIILPNSIAQAKDAIELDNGKLKINKSHIFEVLRIIYESGTSVTRFFTYGDVRLRLSAISKENAFPYQINGIKWLKFLFLNHFGGCLADDMGLGKTFQVISLLGDEEVRKNIEKVLIIVPKSLLTNWKKEFEKFSSDYRVGVYHGGERNKFNFSEFDIIITTYNTASIDLAQLNRRFYSVVIFDEIQIAKNYKSITSNAIKNIKSGIRIGLSGTPMENSVSELWNIMDILNPGAFSSHSAFMTRYNGRNYDELKTILNLFVLRRMKKDVLKELPPKNEQVVYCDMDEAQRKLYTSITVAVREAIMNLKAFSAPVVLKGLTLLRECCCHPGLLDDTVNVEKIRDSCKLDTLNILVANLFESGHKMLIFSNYTSMLQLIKEELEKKDSYRKALFYLDGQTKNRAELVEQFEKANMGIFLISIKAGGVGLNLVSAQDVIITDPWWNPFVEQQAIDRAYRIGQEKAVNVYKLVAANTLEERIIDMQRSKENEFEELINGISTDKNLDINLILNLL